MTIDKQSSDGVARPDRDISPSPIEFRLDPNSGVPTYLQLVQQVERAIMVGFLAQGDQLPRVKDVVGSLAINPNTVLKAYRELEHRGIAVGRPGQGTFVKSEASPVPLAELAALRRGLAPWLQQAAAAGLDDEGISALFHAAMRDFRDCRDGGARPRRGAIPRSRGTVAAAGAA